MKLLVLLLVVFFALWLWKRTGTRRTRTPSQAPIPPNTPSSAMVSCQHCHVHLPQDEGVIGVLGLYCSQAHRNAAGDRSPPL
jgi:uncharacterized protein